MICAWVITIGCYRVDPGVSPNTACLLPKSRRTQKAALFQDILESPLMAAKSKDKVCCKFTNIFLRGANTQGGKDGHGSGEDFMESNICPTLTPETKYKKFKQYNFVYKIQNDKEDFLESNTCPTVTRVLYNRTTTKT